MNDQRKIQQIFDGTAVPTAEIFRLTASGAGELSDHQHVIVRDTLPESDLTMFSDPDDPTLSLLRFILIRRTGHDTVYLAELYREKTTGQLWFVRVQPVDSADDYKDLNIDPPPDPVMSGMSGPLPELPADGKPHLYSPLNPDTTTIVESWIRPCEWTGYRDPRESDKKYAVIRFNSTKRTFLAEIVSDPDDPTRLYYWKAHRLTHRLDWNKIQLEYRDYGYVLNDLGRVVYSGDPQQRAGGPDVVLGCKNGHIHDTAEPRNSSLRPNDRCPTQMLEDGIRIQRCRQRMFAFEPGM